MHICYFGDYDPEYTRSRVLSIGLEKNDVKVSKIQTEGGSWTSFFSIGRKLYRQKDQFDAVLVGYSSTRLTVVLAQIVFNGPVIWDAFISLYDSWVKDRELVSEKHPKAWYYWLIDWIAGQTADHIIFDTNQHKNYFSSEFGVRKEKITRVFIGADTTVFKRSLEKRNDVAKKFFKEHSNLKDKTIVGFHGNYIPLQGVEYIVRAARHIENDSSIHFLLIGNGQTYNKVREIEQELDTDNITFLDGVPFKEIPFWIDLYDISLGIFGDTQKTQRVIPNKVYEATAMAKPVITADTPALRELYTPQIDLLACPPADPKELAKTTRKLAKNQGLQNKIAQQGYETFSNQAKPEVTVLPFVRKLSNLINESDL